ncbi:hypothetical protein [Paenibacillus ihuae]|uniref:hypothetical protein n=1 Tax=Paenibacillus ihuae TaxID=1232431 RepID=UPI0006D5B6CE|nr:hypothetical protein [Paenibacillus ihuae]
MRIKLIPTHHKFKKKRAGITITIAAVVIVGIGAILTAYLYPGPKENPVALDALAPATANDPASVTQTPGDSGIVSGGIETKDGKDLSIWLAAGRDNNFAVMSRKQDETLTMSVESEQEIKLEIGIISVSSDKIYSESIPSGTGTVTITVPEDGDYRVYIKNHSALEAHFRLILDEPLTGPLV